MDNITWSDLNNDTGGTSSSSICVRTEDEEATIALKRSLSFWMEGVAVVVISCVGLLGNFVAIPLLFSKHLDSIFNRILVCLALSDNIFILTALLEGVRKHVVTSVLQEHIFIHFLFPVRTKNIPQWLTF